MIADIAVITPSHPSRTEFLRACADSVAKQTLQPKMHLIGIDDSGAGPAKMRNRLMCSVDTEWVAFLDDDDIFLSNHLELLYANSLYADLIYSFWGMTGRSPWLGLEEYKYGVLQERNYIPVTVLLRRQVAMECGGFIAEDGLEDWGLWRRIEAAGGRIKCVPAVTWLYQYHGGNRGIPPE